MAKIFIASTGRCGTLFCTEIFKTYTDYPAFHEADPTCTGQTLREINNKAGMTKKTRIELQTKLDQIIKNSDPEGRYFESTQMFIKVFVQQVIYRKDFHPLYVIYLHRNPLEVLLSYAVKCKDYELDWFLQPHWQNNLTRCTKGLSFYEIVLWQINEVRERFLLWKDKFDKSFDLNFQDINDPKIWKILFDHFGINHSPLPETFPPDLKKNSNPHNEAEILQEIKLNWNQRGRDLTVSAQEHFFRLKEQQIAQIKKDKE